jgi:hypothetical protein
MSNVNGEAEYDDGFNVYEYVKREVDGMQRICKREADDFRKNMK